MRAPVPSAVGLTQTLSTDAEQSGGRLSRIIFNYSDLCSRSNTSTWVPAPAWEPEAVLDFDEVFLRATSDQRLAMLVVYAEGCQGWTRTVAPLLTSKDILEIARERLHVYAVNADDDEQVVLIDGRSYAAPQLSDMLGVETFPAFVLFEKNGRLIRVLEHPDSTEELRSTLENAAALEFGIARAEQTNMYDARDGGIEDLFESSIEPSPIHLLHLKDDAEERPLAVFFEESDCHHCEHLRDHILSDPRTRSLLEQFRIARYKPASTSVLITPDHRQLTIAQWSRELGVTGAPTVILIDHAGQLIDQTSNHTDLFRFQSLLDYVNSKAYQSDPNFAHFLRHRIQHLRSHGYEIDSRNY